MTSKPSASAHGRYASASAAPGKRNRGVIGVLSHGPLSHGPRILMVRRAAGLVRGGWWGFPGGHLEPGETSRLAVVREFREELGIEVAPSRRLGSLRVEDAGYILAVWRVEHLRGDLRPAPAEIADYRWVTVAEFATLAPLLPSTADVLAMLGGGAKSCDA